MDMTGERRIPAPRPQVWEALNDPEVLKACIPGCDSMEKIGENELKATASIKIGPISAKFAGKVTLSEIDPPNGYTITGEGAGGVAGFAKGGATVALSDDGDGTLLKYDVKAQVGGKIAQLGARLIDATAKQMSDQFFDRFTARLTPAAVEADPVVDEHGVSFRSAAELHPVGTLPVSALIPREIFGIPLVGWGGIAILVVVLILLLRRFS
jgi:carbon monoxide dehydrogenase subunit G